MFNENILKNIPLDTLPNIFLFTTFVIKKYDIWAK